MKCSKFKHNKNGFFEGPLILQPEVYKDERGYFIEKWNMEKFNQILKRPIKFVQDNQSISQKGVLRGMHYQTSPLAQGKLVSCSSGSVFDVIIDLRKNSDTFSFWAGIELKALNFLQLWIPPGFAHGFHDGLLVERTDGAQVENLRVDVVSLGKDVSSGQ